MRCREYKKRYYKLKQKYEKKLEKIRRKIKKLEEKLKEKDRSVELSLVEDVEYSDVSFRHLIVVGQIAKWDVDKALEVLRRTGYKIDDTTRRDVERRLKYARKWLEKYAPERLKFEVAEKVDVEFNEDEKEFLKLYSERLSPEMSPEDIHNLVYEVSREIGLKPSKAFQAIYKAILGKTCGPRAGYFIKSLGIEWVKNKFKECYEKN